MSHVPLGPNPTPVDQIITEEGGDAIRLYRPALESGALRTVVTLPEGESGVELTDRDAAALARALLQSVGL